MNTKNRTKPYKFLMMLPLFIGMSGCAAVSSETKPDHQEVIPEESVPHVRWGEPQHQISPMFTGLNTSYFNDLEHVWALGDVEQRLREMRVATLRWPGGEETSRYHWEHPGVDGYVDRWNPDHYSYRWQSIRVGEEHWDAHTLFVDIDRFIERCIRIGAEPLVGLNLSSGEVMNRRADGIAAAVRLVEYILEQGYPVRYLYLCNEPWHPGDSNYFHFKDDLYAEVYLEYARAVRAVAPDLKLIASPANSLRWTSRVIRFMDIAGEYTDYLNFHAYWAWRVASEEAWKGMTPMRNFSDWIPVAESQTFDEDMRVIRRRMDEAGWNDVGIAMLEWNIGPLRDPDAGTLMTPYQSAIAQAEMLLQLAAADVRITCMWPMFWSVRAPGFTDDLGAPEQAGTFRSPFNPYPPYSTRPTFDMFLMLRELSGGEWLETASSDPNVLVSAVRAPTTAIHVYLINKSDETRTVAIPSEGHTVALDHSFDEHGRSEARLIDDGSRAELPAWSMTHLRIVPLPVAPGR